MEDFLIRRIKFSTFAIGIRNYTRNSVDIIGSGFYYDTRGYFLSAGHVLRKVKEIQKENEISSIKSEMVTINTDSVDNRFVVKAYKIEDILLPETPKEVTNPTAPIISDLGIGRIKQETEKRPFLKIKQAPDFTEPHIHVGEEVVLCGYPAGEQSLSFTVDRFQGLRFSPVMQFGHISALLPSDDSIPYGIQTDILSTGGSSGSSIVSIKTGEVVAIAQKIIVTYAEVNVPEKAQRKTRMPEKLQGFAHIGLIYGDSFNMFNKVPDMTKDDFSKGIGGVTSPTYTQGHVRPEYRLHRD